MNQSLKVLSITLCAFIIGAIANNFATSQALPGFKVAVVNVKKVVDASKEVNVLKADRKSQIDDLTMLLKKAKADVAAEKDATKKKALEDSYDKELNDRKKTMDKNYLDKLAVIDNNISSVIQAKAKEMNYDLVLSKEVVLYGSHDITDEVAKNVK